MEDEEDEIEYEPEEFIVGEKSYSITTVAYLPIHVLMKNQGQGVEISGQKLWCGSLCIIQYLINYPTIVANSLVIELGAGTGLLGMFCKDLGAFKVVLTDHDERCIRHMTADSNRNRIETSVAFLNWFKPLEAIENMMEALNDGSRLILVAGDVIYKHALLDPFFNTVKLLLSTYKSTANKSNNDSNSPILLLCHVPRAGVTHEDVINMAHSKGLSIEDVPESDWKTNINAAKSTNSVDCLSYCPMEDLNKAMLYKVMH
mmetsp:Transcript_1670/g.2661  ORF Transcript_1670/g.2661 Transcript_1670/m.2661 type:complete len:259 (+) Transcript_1670:38-814(+)